MKITKIENMIETADDKSQLNEKQNIAQKIEKF